MRGKFITRCAGIGEAERSTLVGERLAKCFSVILLVLSVLSARPLIAAELHSSEIDRALLQLRYSTQDKIDGFKYDDESSSGLDDFSSSLVDDVGDASLPGRKSVLKAGILSFLVPGLGQVYNGSHIGKVALFAGAEVGALLGAKKYDDDGNNTVAEFEAIARANWNENDYWDYLLQVYNDTTDADDDRGATHGHHLPSTHTQQYFEMIGKYDQFSYGWARAEGHGADSGQIADTAFVWSPSDSYNQGNRFNSPMRIAYNTLRADANTSFDNRDRMVIFVILNHVVSSVDAVLAASRHNRKLEGSRSGLSFHPSLRRDENWALIPELKVSLKF